MSGHNVIFFYMYEEVGKIDPEISVSDILTYSFVTIQKGMNNI